MSPAILAVSSVRGLPTIAASTCFSRRDRKSTRLNSSHRCISYAVSCLKKKKVDRSLQHYRKPCDPVHGAVARGARRVESDRAQEVLRELDRDGAERGCSDQAQLGPPLH